MGGSPCWRPTARARTGGAGGTGAAPCVAADADCRPIRCPTPSTITPAKTIQPAIPRNGRKTSPSGEAPSTDGRTRNISPKPTSAKPASVNFRASRPPFWVLLLLLGVCAAEAAQPPAAALTPSSPEPPPRGSSSVFDGTLQPPSKREAPVSLTRPARRLSVRRALPYAAGSAPCTRASIPLAPGAAPAGRTAGTPARS